MFVAGVDIDVAIAVALAAAAAAADDDDDDDDDDDTTVPWRLNSSTAAVWDVGGVVVTVRSM
jgi:hypothetical protein